MLFTWGHWNHQNISLIYFFLLLILDWIFTHIKFTQRREFFVEKPKMLSFFFRSSIILLLKKKSKPQKKNNLYVYIDSIQSLEHSLLSLLLQIASKWNFATNWLRVSTMNKDNLNSTHGALYRKSKRISLKHVEVLLGILFSFCKWREKKKLFSTINNYHRYHCNYFVLTQVMTKLFSSHNQLHKWQISTRQKWRRWRSGFTTNNLKGSTYIHTQEV